MQTFAAGNSYLGLAGQAPQGHSQRARIARALLRRGHCVPDNPWSSLMLNHDHMGEKWHPPTHWQPLYASPAPGELGSGDASARKNVHGDIARPDLDKHAYEHHWQRPDGTVYAVDSSD